MPEAAPVSKQRLSFKSFIVRFPQFFEIAPAIADANHRGVNRKKNPTMM
jgi:hypothetical protein